MRAAASQIVAVLAASNQPRRRRRNRDASHGGAAGLGRRCFRGALPECARGARCAFSGLLQALLIAIIF